MSEFNKDAKPAVGISIKSLCAIFALGVILNLKTNNFKSEYFRPYLEMIVIHRTYSAIPAVPLPRGIFI